MTDRHASPSNRTRPRRKAARAAARCWLAVLTLACGDDRIRTDEDGAEAGATALRARPLTDVTFESTPARIERGRYLANGVTMCIWCHSERDTTRHGWPPREGMEGSGRIVSDEDRRRMVAPNLTPDPETGTGTWPDDALARAIREGVGHDGRALARPMYWRAFRSLSDEDVASIVVYLRSLPPIRNPLPARALSQREVARLNEEPEPITGPVPHPDASDPLERGRYLIRLGDCRGCHTSWYFDPKPGPFAGGNHIGAVFSSNLTPDESGAGSWSEVAFRQVMRTGRGGTLSPAMPWVAFANMSDEDLDAILATLRTVPPVRHWISNSASPSFCEVCGQEHGFGSQNELVPIVATDIERSVLADYAGTYVYDGPDEDVGDEVAMIGLDGRGLFLVMESDTLRMVPLTASRFHIDWDGPEIGEFVRDETGAVSHYLHHWGGIDVDRFVRRR